MDQVAVFVDAGYLFAQGSAAVAGRKISRSNISLDAPAVVQCLREVAAGKAPHSTLLRIYWYDGAIGGIRPTVEQAAIASLDDLKLRLGFVNSQGQQKGVDSLIVTDLIELARLKSITNAVLLSGDEDVRVGVQIAQSHGVRVHLLGIAPTRGSQSRQLMQEADTTTEWDGSVIGRFLSVRQASTAAPPSVTSSGIGQVPTETPRAGAQDVTSIETVVRSMVAGIASADLDGLSAYWSKERGVPSDFDGKLLWECRETLGRALTEDEKRHMRATFQQLAKARIDQQR